MTEPSWQNELANSAASLWRACGRRIVKKYTKDDNDVESVTVTVEDAEGNVTTQPRSLLRHRKRHTICVAHLSDDKKHDRFAMQHFTEKELPWLEKYMRDNFPNDLDEGCEYITRFHRHSDNASQHFKNTGAIEFFTSLIKKHGRDASKCKYVYSFGAPGHGKGCFDGIGGTFKHKVHNLIKSTKSSGQGIPGVESGYIGSVDEVIEALKHHFTGDGEDAQAQRKASKNPIYVYKFFLHKTNDNPIKRPTEKFIPLEQITKNYQFSVSGVGNVHMRNRSCWCMKCMQSFMKGSLEWPAMKSINGCSSSTLSTTVYSFNKRECKKTEGVGVTTTRMDRMHDRYELASNLTHGDWMLFKGQDGAASMARKST